MQRRNGAKVEKNKRVIIEEKQKVRGLMKFPDWFVKRLV